MNAKDALQPLEIIQRVTLDPGGTSIDRIGTPNTEQNTILTELHTKESTNPRD